MRVINYDANTKMAGNYPVFHKLGAINRSGEMTPFVWKGRLMRLELSDPTMGKNQDLAISALIRDVETGKIVSTCAQGGYFHSAYVEDDTVYVLCVDRDTKTSIFMYQSSDLVNWEEKKLFTRPGWRMFNTA